MCGLGPASRVKIWATVWCKSCKFVELDFAYKYLVHARDAMRALYWPSFYYLEMVSRRAVRIAIFQVVLIKI